MAPADLSHLDAHGHARMVDVTQKAQTQRRAIARCSVTGSRTALVAAGTSQDSEILALARVTGIQAAKLTPNLIPLCHPLLIGDVGLEFEVHADSIDIEASVECFGQTGVEMEALTACAAAALAICDLCRPHGELMTVHDLRVWEKSGGRSGTWRLQSDPGEPHLGTR